MEDTKKADALKEISDFLDRPKLVIVGGKEYELAKLRPVDLADARDYVVTKRTWRFLDSCQTRFFDAPTRAQTIAAIECAPLSIYDVLQDPHGRLRLIWLSVTRLASSNGSPPPMKQFEKQLDPMTENELYAFVMWISGIVPDPASDQEADENPLSSDEATTPSRP